MLVINYLYLMTRSEPINYWTSSVCSDRRSEPITVRKKKTLERCISWDIFVTLYSHTHRFRNLSSHNKSLSKSTSNKQNDNVTSLTDGSENCQNH